MLDTAQEITRIAVGVGLGATIGLERQWRSRMAGLRTNALVSLGATLFVIMGGFSFADPHADPTRVAAQVVSGIGFLGAGVIWKQGATISGLNTAATLWASAAVGALAGGGLLMIAVIGTVAVIAANVLLRPVARVLDRQRGHRVRDEPAVYTFEVGCRTDAEAEIRGLVFAAVARPHLTVQSIAAVDLPEDEGGGVRISTTAVADERDDRLVEAALADVVTAPAVTSVRWSVAELGVAD